jgi:hypothetical protein
VLLNWNGGATGGTVFGNGSSGIAASLDAIGNFGIAGMSIIPRVHIATHPEPNVNSDGQSIVINARAGQGVFLNWDGGGASVDIGNGASSSVAHFDTSGNFHANGNITSGGAKSFRIVHPLDDTKYLTHTAIEGPENGVYYHGEGQTQNGFTTITLPDYFEALTRPEKRTVLLTPLFEDDNESFGMVAAGRVVDGGFRVRSDNPSQKFYWEVKAVRADIDELEVETTRTEETPVIQPIAPSFRREDAGKGGEPGTVLTDLKSDDSSS